MFIDLEYFAAQAIRARALVHVDHIRMVMIGHDGQCSVRLPELTLRLVPEWTAARLLACLPMVPQSGPGAGSEAPDAPRGEGGGGKGRRASRRAS